MDEEVRCRYTPPSQFANSERLDGPRSSYGYRCRRYRAEAIAIKRAFYDTSAPLTSQPAEREQILLSQCVRHPNIIRLREMNEWRGAVISYLDYIELNLEKLITPPCSPISPVVRKKYLLQILSGIKHCHYIGFAHRHLEPRFVLVDPFKETLKISEFGEAMWLKSSDLNSRLADPNFGYRAPEVLLGPQFSAAADMWAVGCIFAAMVRHSPLFHGNKREEELLSIFSLLGRPDVSTWPELGSSFDCIRLFQDCKPKDLRSEYWGCFGIEDTGLDLLQKMLTLNPKYRITAEEALKHPYFNETPGDIKTLNKRKFEEICEHDFVLECGEVMSVM